MGERKNYNKLPTCITKFSKLKGAGNHEVISYSGLAFRKLVHGVYMTEDQKIVLDQFVQAVEEENQMP